MATFSFSNLKPLPIGTRLENENLRPFFTQSLDLLCIAGFDGYFKHLNPMWTTRLGWTVEELVSKPFIDFVHSEDRETTLAEIDQLIKGEKSISLSRARNRSASRIATVTGMVLTVG